MTVFPGRNESPVIGADHSVPIGTHDFKRANGCVPPVWYPSVPVPLVLP